MPRIVVPLIAASAGASWLIALFLPWRSSGTLSRSSLLDAVELVRRGAADALVPAGVAVLLVVPALAGIVLIGLVGLAGRTVAVVRAIALAIGAVASLGLAAVVTDLDPTVAGPGVWIALAGVAAALGCGFFRHRA